MAEDRHIYGEVNSKTGMKRLFTDIGRDAGALRHVGEDEFGRTARKINRRAHAIGTNADYDEKWGAGR